MKLHRYYLSILIISTMLQAQSDSEQLRKICPVDDRITCNEILEKIIDLCESVSVCCDELDMCIDEINTLLEGLPCNVEIPIAQAQMPFTITTPGKYCVQENLSGTITIAADDVFVDLNGFKISNGPTNNIVADTQQNITIVNGIVGDAGLNGIFLLTCTTVIISDIKFEDSDTGCELQEVQGFRVHNCTFENHNSNTDGALYLNNSKDGKVSRCSFYNNIRTQFCLAVEDSSNIVFYDVSIENSTATSFFNVLRSNSCKFVACKARSTSGLATFNFNNARACSCFGCQATDASGVGFNAININSVVFDQCSVIGTSNNVGFSFGGNVSDVCVLNSIAAEASTGFRFTTGGNYIFNNLAKNNTGLGFDQPNVANVYLSNVGQSNVLNFSGNIPDGNLSLFITTGVNAGKFRNVANTTDVTPSDWNNISII